MIRSVTFFWLILAIAASGALFRVSYRTQHLERHLASVDKQIGQEEEAIRVLQAEWNYLNDPSRLEALSRKHLPLGPTSPAQIVTLDQVPNKSTVPAPSVVKGGKPIAAPSANPIMANYKRHTTDD
jgi:cell division protein FtsL